MLDGVLQYVMFDLVVNYCVGFGMVSSLFSKVRVLSTEFSVADSIFFQEFILGSEGFILHM